MTPQSAPAGRVRPAGRGPEVRAAVLAATLAELAENGYAAVTVDNVARRSGVHKTTIYRRWKDREALVADAVAERAGTAKMPFPDTGDIDTDLLRLARMTVVFLTSPAGGPSPPRRRPMPAGYRRSLPRSAASSRPSSGKRSRSSPAPSHAASFPPTPIQPS